ncbi:MAG: TonB-dependent receptor [Rhizomicrobium sp.]
MLGPALLASTMLAGVPALAQDNAPELETITVTAEKHTEDLQKVPMNVQALTNEKLSDLGATDFTKFAQFLPSVEYTVGGAGGGNGGPGFYNISMRGVNSGNDGNHSGPSPTVGVYLDEQPITTIGGTLDIPTYDVSRVEALSGPQGTLYGASSEAGTIRIITNKPDPSQFEASYSAQVNSVDHGSFGYNADGMINVPLNEKMAIRLVAWDEHDGGYIDNLPNTLVFPTATAMAGHTISISNDAIAKNNFNTVNKLGARIALGIDLDSNWTITPTFMAESEKSDGVFGYDPSVGYLKTNQYYPDYSHDKWYQAALTIQGKIGDLDLVYSGGYMNRVVHAESDYTSYTYWYDKLDNYVFYDNAKNPVEAAQDIFEGDQFTKLSNEIRLSSPTTDRFHWVVGAFQERQSHYILQNYQIPNLGSIYWVPGWTHTLWLTDQHRIDRDLAAFGEATFMLTPSLSITGGIRLFQASNTLSGFYGFNGTYYTGEGTATCFAPSSFHHAPCTDLNNGTKASGETHKVNVTWQVTDDKMLYATYSTGFRPGGDNRSAVLPPYQPDKLTNYEAGWKTTWADGTFRWNGDFFLEDWQNFQFAFLGLNSLTQIENAPSAQIKGIESDFQWLIGQHFTLTGAGAYTDAELTKSFCGVSDPVTGALITQCPGPVDTNPPDSPKGTTLPITPKIKFNLTGRYEFGTIGGFDPYVQGAMVYQSSAWPDLRVLVGGAPLRGLIGEMPGFTTAQLAAGVSHDNWTAEISVQNLFDSHGQLYRYAQCTTQVCGYQPYVIPTQPRLFAVTFSQKF